MKIGSISVKYSIVIALVMSLFISSLSVAENQMQADDGRNNQFWKEFPQNHQIGLLSGLESSDLLKNIRDIRLDGLTASVSGNLITLYNLRVLSDTTDFDDYLSIDLLMDIESLKLIPGALEITSDLGVYYPSEYLFSKDVARDIFMITPSGDTLAPDLEHTITAGKNHEFEMYLEAGTVVTMRLFNLSDDYELQIDRPDGRTHERSLFRKNSQWIAFGRSILKSGVYIFRFVPKNNSTLTLQFGFTNNNRTPISNLLSGNNLSASLSGWGHEYAKYSLALNKGALVEVTDPSDDDVWLYLVNSNSRHVKSGGGEIYVRVSSSGIYYLFVVNKDHAAGSSYSGTVRITPDPDISRYPVMEDIPEQITEKGKAYSLQLAASNAPTKFSATGFPAGVSMEETSGLISGAPSISGKFPIRVSAENEFGSDRKDFLLTVRSNLVWDADSDQRWSMPDIIYGLQTMTGIR